MVKNFDEAARLLHDRINLERLQNFTSQDMEGRLDSLQAVLDSLGNPEAAYRSIHIAGTKGKGSTCILLESIFCSEGFCVGRFTSPHLYSFTERLTINGIPCPPSEFAELFFSVYEEIDQTIFQSLTYFELLTLLAFIHFSRKKVNVAIFEVGLGGRLDATNLCQPEVSVITSISYDHTLQLGATLADIAKEKSGIIKPSIPVVTTVQHPEPLNIIRNKAQSLDSPLYVLNEHFFVRQTDPAYTFQYESQQPEFPTELMLNDITLKMPGEHQIHNAAAAISAFLLSEGTRVNDKKIRLGLMKAALPLRVEIIRRNKEAPVFIFDGAHNQASVHALTNTVSEMYPNYRCLLIFGTSLGKDVQGMFAEIKGCFESIFLTQCSESNRRFPPQEMQAMFADSLEASFTVFENCQDALKQCLNIADKDDVICVSGSLYLAAELRKYFMEEDDLKSNGALAPR